jgi:hypothetical protein
VRMPTRLTYVALAVGLLIAGGCTLEDGQPWGWVRAGLQVSEPSVDADFAVDVFELELATVRLIETGAAAGTGAEFDPQNPPAGCSLCHGGHCHCDGELVDYDELRARVADGGASRRVLANIDHEPPITEAARVDLQETSVDARAGVDTIEVELRSLTLEGTLTIDGQDYPTTMSLPGIGGTRFSAPVSMTFGPDSPEDQHLEIELVWADDWLAEVDLDQLDIRDSEVLIASSSNRDAARLIVERVARSSIEVTGDDE